MSGVVNAFDLDGEFVRRVAAEGPLNAPWAVALAPSNFGEFSGQLLIGNFGDGRINVYDKSGGDAIAPLRDGDGDTLEIEGLWGLAFGNGSNAGSTDSLLFTAGIDDEEHGLMGRLTRLQ